MVAKCRGGISSVKVGSFAGGSGVRRATMRTRPATCDGAGGSAVCIAASAAGGFSGTVTWRAGAERIVPNPSRPMRMPEVGRAFPVGSASTTSTLNGFGGSGDDRPHSFESVEYSAAAIINRATGISSFVRMRQDTAPG